MVPRVYAGIGAGPRGRARRSDHRLELAIDRETGLVACLEERYGDVPSRLVTATELAPDASIPDSAFSLAIPASAAMIY